MPDASGERSWSTVWTAEDLWFDPLFLVVKGMQDKQMEVLECIKMFADMGTEVHRRSVQQLQRYAEDTSVRSWTPLW